MMEALPATLKGLGIFAAKAVIRQHAERFGRERFGDDIEALVTATARGASVS